MSGGRPWLVRQTSTRDIHTIPLGDLIQHEDTEDCVCRPTARPIIENWRLQGWIHVHHSLDGREQQEAP